MGPSHRRPRRSVLGRADKAVAVTLTQAVTAGGSLVLQIIAARGLGLAGYGAFAVCLSLLTTATALYTGYVGDALTVMDRDDPGVRRAIALSAVVGLAGVFGLGTLLVVALGLGSLGAALLYALMLVLWLVEETGRRLLMSRLEFWKLVANDATYVAATLVALLLIVLVADLRLGTMFLAMAIGAAASVLLALVQLPRAEWTNIRPAVGDTRKVAGFAVWRSLQSTLKPTQLLAARLLLLQLVSLSAVGAVESGRLVVAPMQTVLNGAASLLLSTGASRRRQGKAAEDGASDKIAAGLVAITMAGSVVAALLSHPLGALMAGHRAGHLLVLGWGIYMAAWAGSLPFTAELTVRRLARPVFVARLVETVVGLGLIAIVLAGGGSSDLVPWLLSAPALLNVGYIRSLARRTRTPAVAAAGETIVVESEDAETAVAITPRPAGA